MAGGRGLSTAGKWGSWQSIVRPGFDGERGRYWLAVAGTGGSAVLLGGSRLGGAGAVDRGGVWQQTLFDAYCVR